MFRPLFFASRIAAACALMLFTARCGGEMAPLGEEPPEAPETLGQSRAAATSDELRYRWTRFARASVQPRLVALGVSDAHIRRAVWFGLSEGIFTVGNNTGYGQPNGRQSPIGFSNCGDRPSVNSTTAFPDCFGSVGVPATSGNWQVGLAGAQVSDHMPSLPQRYRALYGELPPKLLGQSILGWLGQSSTTFPDITIDSLAQQANSRWASVILRDPALNVYTQTFNSVIRGTSNLGLFKEIVDAVWNEAAQTQSSLYFSQTNQHVVGQLAQYWQSGSGRWACWAQQNEVCLATWGLPITGEYAVSGSIPGSDGHRVREQRFERALLQINWYSSTGNIVQGALLGSQKRGLPGNANQAIDPAFRAYYLRYGGLSVFGYALEPAKTENGRRVQYFERARLEATTGFNSNTADPVWEVQRGLLGVETR